MVSLDLVITDPPFGGLLHYSELSDFFYVWLRLPLKDKYPDVFGCRIHTQDLWRRWPTGLANLMTRTASTSGC